jgi:phenylpropionate dioxygenase-like ring-hydroxylating dioxygenase large terminal subunit
MQLPRLGGTSTAASGCLRLISPMLKENLTCPKPGSSAGGFVWINMDADAPSLRDYIGPEALARIEAWKLEDRYVACHVSKPIPCNWKLNIDAFM